MKSILSEKLKRRKQQEKRLIIGIVTGFVLLIIIFMMYGLGIIGSHPEKVAGTWIYDNYMSFEFDGKQKGCMYLGDLEYDYTYKIRRNRLKLDFTDDAVKDCIYKFDINDDSLTLVGGEGTSGGTYQLKRK